MELICNRLRIQTYKRTQVVVFDEAQKLQVTAGHRYLNLTVWLSSSGAESKSVEPSPSKPKTNLTSLFRSRTPEKKMGSSLHQVPAAQPESKDTAIGHVNIALSDLAADCMLNTQGHHISTYHLHPADMKCSLG